MPIMPDNTNHLPPAVAEVIEYKPSAGHCGQCARKSPSCERLAFGKMEVLRRVSKQLLIVKCEFFERC